MEGFREVQGEREARSGGIDMTTRQRWRGVTLKKRLEFKENVLYVLYMGAAKAADFETHLFEAISGPDLAQLQAGVAF